MSDRLEEITVTSKKRGSDSSTAQIVPKKRLSANLNADIEDNVLDIFDLPTYHFRLYMMSDDAIRQKVYGPRADNQRVVIAESGVTVIEIDEVEVTSVSGITRATGIGTATEFSLSLKEPFGATLLDQISNAATFLDIKNFAKIPFFLELSFRGRKAGEGQKQEAGSLGELNDLVWTWPLIFTKMAMDVSTGGTVYQIQAAIYGDLAYTNQVSDAQKPMTIKASTVGEFFTEYEKQMNDRSIEKGESAGYKKTDTFKFFIDEDIAKALIVPDLFEERQGRSAPTETEDGKLSFTLQPPISVDRVVENILSLTPLFQKDLADDKEGAGSEAITPKLYRLIADAEMKEYDEKRSDYQRIYRYLIISYEMPTVMTQANITSTQSDEERYNAIANKGLIKKLYNYIYTGLNDQVLDFELVFNFNWYAALPLQGGVSTNPADAEPKTVLTDEYREKLEENAEKIAQLRSFAANPAGFAPISFFEDALSEFISPLADIIDEGQNTIDAAQTTVSDVIGDAIAVTNDATSTIQNGIEDTSDFVSGVVDVPGLSNTTDRLLAATQFPRVKSPNIGSPSSAQDDLRGTDIFLDDPKIGEKARELLQQSIAESKSGDSNADVAQGSQSSERTMLSAMFEQARSPVTGDLLDIDLNIKGDPYWLEPPPIHRNAAPRSTFDRMLRDRGFPKNEDGTGGSEGSGRPEEVVEDIPFSSANASESQTFMVFRSFTPKEFSPVTGLTPAGKKSNNVLNGVYGVRMVKHSFVGGVFTQTLHGIRNPKINLQYVNLLAHLGVGNNKDEPADTGDESTGPRTTQVTTDDAAGAVPAVNEILAIGRDNINIMNNTLSGGPITPTGPVDFSGRPITGPDGT